MPIETLHAKRPAVDAPPALSLEAASREHRERSRRQVAHCVLLAVVTSPEVSADLIDRAIDLSRHPAI